MKGLLLIILFAVRKAIALGAGAQRNSVSFWPHTRKHTHTVMCVRTFRVRSSDGLAVTRPLPAGPRLRACPICAELYDLRHNDRRSAPQR